MIKGHKITLYVTVLLLLFGMITGTFCYFLGKTDTFMEALGQFRNFGIGLFPLFIVVFVLAVADLRKIKRERENR